MAENTDGTQIDGLASRWYGGEDDNAPAPQTKERIEGEGWYEKPEPEKTEEEKTAKYRRMTVKELREEKAADEERMTARSRGMSVEEYREWDKLSDDAKAAKSRGQTLEEYQAWKERYEEKQLQHEASFRRMTVEELKAEKAAENGESEPAKASKEDVESTEETESAEQALPEPEVIREALYENLEIDPEGKLSESLTDFITEQKMDAESVGKLSEMHDQYILENEFAREAGWREETEADPFVMTRMPLIGEMVQRYGDAGLMDSLGAYASHPGLARMLANIADALQGRKR